jgi:NADH-quinone oxidoreductase subunit L
LTSLYTFRLIFVVFFGPVRTPVSRRPALAMTLPVCVLAVLSIVGGFDKAPFARFMATALPSFQEEAGGITETLTSVVAALAFLGGLLGAWIVYQRNPTLATAMVENPVGRALHRFWFSDWGMDWLYDRLFVRPVVWIARVNKADAVDSIYDGLASLAILCYRALSLTETGKLRWYAAWIAGGSAIFVAIVMFL